MAPTGFAVVVLFLLAIVLTGTVLLTMTLIVGMAAALAGGLARLIVVAVDRLVREFVVEPHRRDRTVPIDEPLWRFLDERAPRAA